jgi:hypothetical protein
MVSLRRLPRIGLGFGLAHLARSGHPALVLVIVVLVVGALVAARSSRRR